MEEKKVYFYSVRIFILALSLLFLKCSGMANLDEGEAESVIQPPVLIKSPERVYPAEAKLKLQQGSVGLILLLDTNGTVQKVRLTNSSGYPLLDSAALEFSNGLVFTPVLENGKPVNRWLTMAVEYKLEEENKINSATENLSVLVFTKVSGFLHESIPAGATAIRRLSEDFDFFCEITDDSTVFSGENLNRFDVVIFLNTSGKILNEKGRNALKSFINNGGGFVGIHSASVTEVEWEWYGNLVGTFFDDHPEIQTALLNVVNKNHPSTTYLPEKWRWTDEYYNWQTGLSKNIRVLLTVDESTYEGGKHPEFHPISWCQEFEGGRSWYTALGHEIDHYKDPNFLNHILGGILWAANRTSN